MNLPWLSNKCGPLAAAFSLALTLGACGSDGSGREPESGYSQAHAWERIVVARVEESGTTIPFVVARQSDDRQVHMAYYNSITAQNDTVYHRLHYLVWDPSTETSTSRVVANRQAPSGLNGFDRCDQFDLAVDGSTPVLIYPTYEINTVLQQAEADIMVNRYEMDAWNENTGAVGYVDRNPVYQDGHTTENMSVAVDRLGGVHFCYQYFTEGMDSANYRYPDLYYAYYPRDELAVPITDIGQYADIEEQVDGNLFSTYGDHNSVGFYCKLLLAPDDERPVIVYGEHGEDFAGSFALKVAAKNTSGQWRRETIDALPDGWTVGGIDAAFYPPDPEDPEAERPLAIAYALRSPSPEADDAHRLLFAVKRNGQWTTEIVDETTWCGTHCALAFSPDRLPAIAYFDEQSHSGRSHQYLKFARFNGLLWVKESAAEQGLLGRHNSLWFDARGRPTICTYAEEDSQIVLIRQIN
jgi:hypothetical protein